MLKPVFVKTLLVTLALYATSTGATTDEEPSPAVQDAYGMLLQEARANSGTNQMREMARLYELIQMAAMQQTRQNANMEEEVDGGELLPIPERLIAAMQENEEFAKDKRGSYMSLCHFKICNMGRKRNPYWNSWIRV